PILAIFEPMTFPREISENPLRAACRLTKSSGAEVAKDTTVRPITIFDNFSLKERATEDLTRNSPPTTSKARPIRINKKLMNFFSEDKETSLYLNFKIITTKAVIELYKQLYLNFRIYLMQIG